MERLGNGHQGTNPSGIAAARLPQAQYDANFSDLHPRLDKHEALVASDRCYFCYDAPCMTACPTSIDIPLFIRQISTGNPLGSAKTIFDQNIHLAADRTAGLPHAEQGIGLCKDSTIFGR